MSNPYQSQIDQLQQEISDNQKHLNDPELAELASQEIERLELQKKTLEEAAQTLEKGQESEAEVGVEPKNCIVEIRPGAGGDEAKIWAEDLLRMYSRFAETLQLKIEYLDDLVVKFKGNANWDLEAKTPYKIFKYESGVHRVQRVPETESQGRIHTSTASVAVLPEVHPHAVEIREEDLEWQFMRAGGAGGQNVNKVNSAVRLTHTPSGLSVSARQEKKQDQNRKIALELLRSQLWEIEEEKRLAKIGDARSAIGRNMRAEKIRTYNYPQNRVTDHRINQSWYNLESIVEGNLKEVVEKLHEEIELITKTTDQASDSAE